MFLALIKRDFALSTENLSDLAQPPIFFILTTSIFSLTAGNQDLNTAIAIIWICLTLAILIGSNQQFYKDFNDGTLEQLYLSGYIFELIILAKIINNWIFNNVVLIITLPLIAIILGIPINLIPKLMIIATISSLIINFIISFGSSLILSLGNKSILLIIMVLPIIIPTLIFANSAFGSDFVTSIKLLGSLLLFLAPILTFATSFATKISIVD